MALSLSLYAHTYRNSVSACKVDRLLISFVLRPFRLSRSSVVLLCRALAYSLLQLQLLQYAQERRQQQSELATRHIDPGISDDLSAVLVLLPR